VEALLVGMRLAETLRWSGDAVEGGDLRWQRTS
jgi:hypothetical protein